MTDDEILAKAQAITDRRKRAARGREFMRAPRVTLTMAGKSGEILDHIDIERDANLAALLCRLLDCDIWDGQ